MLRRVISALCLALLLVPAAAFGAEEADWTENIRRQERCAELAKTLPERSMNGDGFFVMGTDKTHMKPFHELAKDKIEVIVTNNTGIISNLINTIFHREDAEAVKEVVESINRYYLSSMASGYWKLMPRSDFTSDGIYKEANARNLYQIFYWQDVGVGTSEEYFRYEINKLRIDGDYAQVVITRFAELTSSEPVDGVIQSANLENDIPEAYLLQKHDGEWKIANIMFGNRGDLEVSSNEAMDTQRTKLNKFLMFAKADGAETWKNGFTFESCPTEDYSPFGNYSDFIIGDLNAPQFDYDRFLYCWENGPAIRQFWNETAGASENTLEDFQKYKEGMQS